MRLARVASQPQGLRRMAIRSMSGDVKKIWDDKALFPDQVHEEEKTGIPMGLPMPRDPEIWASHEAGEANDILLPERAELWWDDGTAEPEWFVDRGSAGGANGGRGWAVSNSEAVGQLLTMFGTIAVFIGGGAYLLNNNLQVAANRWDHGLPENMRSQFGLEKRKGYVGTANPAAGEDDEDEDEE